MLSGGGGGGRICFYIKLLNCSNETNASVLNIG